MKSDKKKSVKKKRDEIVEIEGRLMCQRGYLILFS